MSYNVRDVKVILVDTNASVVKAWRDTFTGSELNVEIKQGSIFNTQADAWITPTNWKCQMNGGLDLLMKQYFSDRIETRLQGLVKNNFNGILNVGQAAIVQTHKPSPSPSYLIATATMQGQNDDVSTRRNTAYACAAAFQTVHQINWPDGSQIKTVAMPGLGTGTGKVNPLIAADLMWAAFSLFRRKMFMNFKEMQDVLKAELGDVSGAIKKIPIT